MLSVHSAACDNQGQTVKQGQAELKGGNIIGIAEKEWETVFGEIYHKYSISIEIGMASQTSDCVLCDLALAWWYTV